jgi:predicted RNA methylase
MEFGDGTAPLSLSTLPNNGIVQHTYNLIAGQEDVFNPTLTVTNKTDVVKQLL